MNDIDNLKATELRLGLPGIDETSVSEKPAPAPAPETARTNTKRSLPDDSEPSRDAKAQVVGWPPVRSFRRNSLQITRKTSSETTESGGGLYVKVSMDGAPYLRKIDLKMYKGYKDLRLGLEDMFKCFSLGDLSGKDQERHDQHAIAYEDKDGDLMLAGDVPWEMFMTSCKKLRIMRGSEARGLGSTHQ